MNNQFIRGIKFEWDNISEESYLRKIEALKDIESLEFSNPVTFFVGENGTGKSTLLEAIAISHGFNPEGGTKNYSFSTHDTHSELYDAIRIVKGFRKRKIRIFSKSREFLQCCNNGRRICSLCKIPRKIPW